MDQPLTIAKLARAAGVGVETIRYYERRKLIAQPRQRLGAYRRYDASHIARVRFIRRGQALGFTLDEIASLLALEDGTDRRSVRRIAAARLQEIRMRLGDLQRMARALEHLLHDCETDTRRPSCPIIAAIAQDDR